MELRDLIKCRCPSIRCSMEIKTEATKRKERNQPGLFQTVHGLVPVSVTLFKGHGM